MVKIKKYKIIYADPPWEYKENGSGNRVVRAHYPTMSIDDIKALPVDKIADETSILFMWCTFPRLEQGMEVIKAWGFQYYGLGYCWVKMNKNSDTPFWGMGYYTRQNTEVCLIGVRKDKSKRIKPLVRNQLSVIHSKIEEHSKKPDCVRESIVKVCGDLSRVELFARKKYDGWDCFGEEIDGSDIGSVLGM